MFKINNLFKRSNAKIYNVNNKIETFCSDIFDFLKYKYGLQNYIIFATHTSF